MEGIMAQVLLIVGFFAFMYLVMIRPNKKRQQEMMEMRNSITEGDEIITIGGIKGTVCRVTDSDVTIETSEDKNKIVFVKSAIHSIVVKEDSKGEDDSETEENVEEVE